MASEKPGKSRIHAPKGTRDVYPEDMLRRRYIQKVWRDCSIRHGFEEIDGPMFEQAQLYAVKSGEGILGELFQAYSGKSPEEVEQVKETGRAPFAMRPEFTPTLARMYAERARQLPKPVKWFSIGPFFRAERPQRGRLREFLQWNCDVIGDEIQDAEIISMMILACESFGLQPDVLNTHLNSRQDVEYALQYCGIPRKRHAQWFEVLDKARKITEEELRARGRSIEAEQPEAADAVVSFFSLRKPDMQSKGDFEAWERDLENRPSPLSDEEINNLKQLFHPTISSKRTMLWNGLNERLPGGAHANGASSWCREDRSLVRGLAYYTGTVFELIAEGERSVAGGGRYDNLIELVGGPPTPAVGFAMGDVVLGILLEEKGLMPEGQELRDALSRPPASLRPEAFVVTPDPQRDRDVRRLVAGLRRGTESEAWRARDDRKPWDADRYEPRSGGVPPLHARASAKSTRKISKLLAEAAGQFARFAVIIESDRTATVKDLDLGEDLQRGVDLEGVSSLIASRCSA